MHVFSSWLRVLIGQLTLPLACEAPSQRALLLSSWIKHSTCLWSFLSLSPLPPAQGRFWRAYRTVTIVLFFLTVVMVKFAIICLCHCIFNTTLPKHKTNLNSSLYYRYLPPILVSEFSFREHIKYYDYLFVLPELLGAPIMAQDPHCARSWMNIIVFSCLLARALETQSFKIEYAFKRGSSVFPASCFPFLICIFLHF